VTRPKAQKNTRNTHLVQSWVEKPTGEALAALAAERNQSLACYIRNLLVDHIQAGRGTLEDRVTKLEQRVGALEAARFERE
jgi:hypothetical protein